MATIGYIGYLNSEATPSLEGGGTERQTSMKDVYDEDEQNEVCAAGGVDPDTQVTYFTYRDVVASIGEDRTPEQVARLLREVDREKWGEILTATGQWAEDLDNFATVTEG